MHLFSNPVPDIVHHHILIIFWLTYELHHRTLPPMLWMSTLKTTNNNKVPDHCQSGYDSMTPRGRRPPRSELCHGSESIPSARRLKVHRKPCDNFSVNWGAFVILHKTIQLPFPHRQGAIYTTLFSVLVCTQGIKICCYWTREWKMCLGYQQQLRLEACFVFLL